MPYRSDARHATLPATAAQRPPDAHAAGRIGAAALRSGSIAAIASAVAAAALGRRRTGSAASTTNAASHWIWGPAALRRHCADLRHTALGHVIHHASSIWWALFYEAWRRRAPDRPLARAFVVAALAVWVDYRVVPARLTPGFEAHLRRRDMALIYAVFALGLRAGTRRRRRTSVAAAVRPHSRGFR